jgi:signal transduction histidine kinase
LSITYGIVKEHGGTISVASTPGEGASFLIELPLASDAQTTAP